MTPRRPAGWEAVRAALRAALADVWSDDQVPDTSEWTPHVSVAYSNAAGPAGPYIAALAGCTDSAQTVIGSVQLIILGRDQRIYSGQLWRICSFPYPAAGDLGLWGLVQAPICAFCSGIMETSVRHPRAVRAGGARALSQRWFAIMKAACSPQNCNVF